MGCCTKERVEFETALKVLSAFIVLFSIIEIAIGATAFSWISNVYLGSWWGAILPLFAGILGMLALNRNVVIMACACASIGAITCLFGVVVDGLGTAVFSAETACINTNTMQVWGTSSGVSDAAMCAGNYYYLAHTDSSSTDFSSALESMKSSSSETASSRLDVASGYGFYYYYYNHHFNNYYYNHHFNNYYYNHHFNNYYYNHHFYNNYYYNHHNYNYYNIYQYYYHFDDGMTNKCVCYGDEKCYGYDLANGNDCGSILSTYTNLLVTSTAFLSLLIITTFSLIVLSCFSVNKTSNTAIAPIPAEVQMMPAYNPAYAQAQRYTGPIVYLTPPTIPGYAVAGDNVNVEVAHFMEPNDDHEMRGSMAAASTI